MALLSTKPQLSALLGSSNKPKPALAAAFPSSQRSLAARCGVTTPAVGLPSQRAQRSPASSKQSTRMSRLVAAAAAAPAGTDAEGHAPAHGGALVDLQVPAAEWDAVAASCTKTIEASDRNACDVELLTNGAFSPLTGFLNEAEYYNVVNEMRLKAGPLLGIPVVMDTDREDVVVGDKLLITYKGQNIAAFTVESKWLPDKVREASMVYGTTSLEHPAVQMITMERGRYYMGGKVQGLETPRRVFPCATPREVRAQLPAEQDVLAFQCRNPIHKAHYELFIRALSADNVRPGAVCLVHPTVGPTQDDDIPGDVRYKTYEVLKEETRDPRLRWAYLPYSMHMAGPREAIQHMIIRKNFGCTHFIIGRDMAGSKSCLTGVDFYGPYDAQGIAAEHAGELGMHIVPSLNIAYTAEKGYVTADVADAEHLTKLALSGTKFRQLLREGGEIPDWFAFKSVVNVLRDQAKAEAAAEQQAN